MIRTAIENLRRRIEVVIDVHGEIIGDSERTSTGWIATAHSNEDEGAQSCWRKKKDAIQWIKNQRGN